MAELHREDPHYQISTISFSGKVPNPLLEKTNLTILREIHFLSQSSIEDAQDHIKKSTDEINSLKEEPATGWKRFGNLLKASFLKLKTPDESDGWVDFDYLAIALPQFSSTTIKRAVIELDAADLLEMQEKLNAHEFADCLIRPSLYGSYLLTEQQQPNFLPSR